MATITVLDNMGAGLDVTNPTLNDTLVADRSVNPSSISVTYMTEGTAILQSEVIGHTVEVDINGTLTGTGNVTGSVDPAAGTPAVLVNQGTGFDVNGIIAVDFQNAAGPLTVSAGEKLDVEGNFTAFRSGPVTVASGGEFDANSVTEASFAAIDVEGTLVATAPLTLLMSGSVLNGALVVHGDALNGYGSGVLAARAGTANGNYVATLDLRQAPLATALPSLSLGQDAAVQFDQNAHAIKRFSVNGTGSAVAALDSVLVAGGTITVTGDQSGATGQAVLAGALLTSGNQSVGPVHGTVDLAVAAADHGASLQQVVTVDVNTTLRNDGALTIGGQGSGASTIGASTIGGAAAGSSFINGAGGTISVAGGATLSVAAIQNLGTIDITSGTLAFGAAVSGSGAITVENGATLRLASPSSFAGTVKLAGATSMLDLAGVTATSGTVTNGQIVVATSAGALSLGETGLANGTALAFSADGSGGSVGMVTTSVTTPVTTPGATPVATPGATPVATPVTVPAVSTPVIGLPVFRFFDTVHGTHFFTGNVGETANLLATRTDLTFEGIGLKSIDPTTDSSAVAVYRFFDTKFGTHFYTSNEAEKNSVQATRSDLSYEGIGFYEDPSQQANDVPVVRYFDKNFGTHFYSSSTDEQATIAASRPDLVNEGVTFYAPTT